MESKQMYSISELASRFQVTTRTIRYYEEIGLLNPKRTEGGHRVFTNREETRLQLIFRGKKYGFCLDEIREMIQLFDLDPSGKQQLRKTIEYGQEKKEEVSNQIDDLMLLRSEMNQLLSEFQKKLTKLECEEK